MKAKELYKHLGELIAHGYGESEVECALSGDFSEVADAEKRVGIAQPPFYFPEEDNGVVVLCRSSGGKG